MSDSPDLIRSPGEGLSRATIFGVTHYVQAVLSILAALFVGWVASSAWHTDNLPNQGVDPNDDSFGAGISAGLNHWVAIIYPGISCFLLLFGGFSFLVGNRLICRRWRGFCHVFAIFECVLGAAPVVAGLLIFLLGCLGVVDAGAGLVSGFICFVSFPLTALTCVIGIFTLRMLKRQGTSFV
jgi:hypothetical protein